MEVTRKNLKIVGPELWVSKFQKKNLPIQIEVGKLNETTQLCLAKD